MSTEIHILSPEVIDQIAAGEVVERPAHLVKELVENSIDAGATKIEIKVDQGGRWIQVVDDGGGIPKKELDLALARHATSKIQTSEDLWGLSSYGFRGEALASISAVSRLSIYSKQKKKTGYKIQSEFGKVSEPVESGGDTGTILTVEELFTNTPARLKFLKSDTAEVTQIKNVVRAMALAYPKIQFKLLNRGKLEFLFAKAESELQRAEQVLGKEPLYFGEAEHDGIKAKVAVAPPNVTTGNSRQIWLFAQNRWIQDRSIQAAVMDAYRNLLMHGEFPFACVWIQCPTDEIDVNIHPTKSQVKFLKNQSAFRAANRAVRGVLEKAPWVKKALHGEDLQRDGQRAPFEYKLSPSSPEPVNSKFSGEAFQKIQYKQKSFYSDSEPKITMEALVEASQNRSYKEESELDVALASEDSEKIPVVVASNPTLDSRSDETCNEMGQWASLQILGQSHQTYIVAQNTNSLFLVDQHAAHERVAFESLMAAWKGGSIDVQSYLVPLTIELEADQVEGIVNFTEDLKSLGVHVEAMGPETLAVSAAPTLLKEKALVRTFEKLGSEIVEKGGSFALEKVVADICATMACHSVVRAGQALSQEQMQSLLEQMDEFPLSSFCPHGRPVYVEYPFTKIEKDFGRIV